MFFGQINAPATLPIYVLMHFVNSKFLGRLYCTLPAITCFLNAIQRSLSFASEDRPEENNIVRPHWHRKAYWMYICVTACFVLEFSCCVSRSPPFSPASNENLRMWVDRQTQMQCGSECTYAIRNNLSQGTLLLKGTKTYCPYMQMSKVYGFLWCLCYILVQFPRYSRRTVWNIRQEAVWGHVFPIT